MRMWMVNPKILCKDHILGEHNELHKHRHIFTKKHSIKNRISPEVQIEPSSMKRRHEELVNEMLERKYNHNSPYEQPDLSHLKDNERYATVDYNNSLQILLSRCEKCRERYNENSCL